jgi:GNAT superfamily N-acetyltransferase
VEIRAFTEDDLGDAGTLLAGRHAAHRRREPLLDKRFEAPDAALAEIAARWENDASGAVALRSGRLVGYLLGAPRSGDAWGPNVWVEAAGYAVEEPETVRDLYGLAAQRWFDDGLTAHYALVPADAPDPWYRLGFGQQQVHGVRPTSPEPLSANGFTIREPTPADLDALAALEVVVPEHQSRAPVFSARKPPAPEDARDEWVEVLADPAYTTFVAERDGEVVGTAVGCAATESGHHSGLARPDGAAFLAFAAVRPETRGLGIGGALGRAVLGWAAESGYPSIVTDWRATNLLSSRTWPRLGFRPAFHRLHRLVGY